MICSELMPHFVGYIINIKSIAYRRTTTRNTSRFDIGARRIQIGNTATACAENVPNIVVGTTNHTIASSLIFSQHSTSVAIRVRVSRRIKVNNTCIIGSVNPTFKIIAAPFLRMVFAIIHNVIIGIVALIRIN